MRAAVFSKGVLKISDRLGRNAKCSPACCIDFSFISERAKNVGLNAGPLDDGKYASRQHSAHCWLNADKKQEKSDRAASLQYSAQLV